MQDAARSGERDYIRDLGRAFGGALLFSLPLLMTMKTTGRHAVSLVCQLR
ncbi:DUF2391 family protein [Brevundimonas diminuta]|jgi:hypothetical protein